MGRYLSLLLFLLTLLPVLNIDDASSVSAQSFTYEDGSYWLPDIEVKGNEKNVTCDCCGESFYDEDDLDRHIKYNSVCASFYGFGDPTKDLDDEPINGMCYGCGKSIEDCTCKGADCPGNSVGNKNPPSTSYDVDYSHTNSTPSSTSAKSKVPMTKLVSNFKSSAYNRIYDKKICGYCLRGWKIIWQKSGIGEYANTQHAKDFGTKLEKYGFKVIAVGRGKQRPSGYIPQVGDTRIWDTYPGQRTPSGHIDWWNGSNWVSDYVQQGDWEPGKKYKWYNVSYKIYR